MREQAAYPKDHVERRHEQKRENGNPQVPSKNDLSECEDDEKVYSNARSNSDALFLKSPNTKMVNKFTSALLRS